MSGCIVFLPVRCYNSAMNKNHPGWLPLDNAAKIYPPAMTQQWTALFRVSATLTEPVDPKILEAAQKRTLRRFPSMSMRLRQGVFWYYLDHIDGCPPIFEDVNNPCMRMDFTETKGFSFRVRYYDRRIALEVFHVLADGTGGMCFLKTLVAEYLSLKYGAVIPRDHQILDCDALPDPMEYEDSYLRYGNSFAIPERAIRAYHISGTPIPQNLLQVVMGTIPIDRLKEKAREYDATVNEFLTALLLLTIADFKMHRRDQKNRPVVICVPINLRGLFPSRTMRNFASYANISVDTRLGEYTLEETVKLVRHQMGLEANAKRLCAKFSDNVNIEKNPFLRVAPLFLKKPVMQFAYRKEGDRKSSICFSNLGKVELPEEMARYVTRCEFMLGSLLENPVTCAASAYGDEVYVTFTRTIEESIIEREFFRRMVRLGIPVKIESNRR